MTINASDKCHNIDPALQTPVWTQVPNLHPDSPAGNAGKDLRVPKGFRKVFAANFMCPVERQKICLQRIRPDQDSYHTPQGCVIIQLWTQRVRV